MVRDNLPYLLAKSKINLMAQQAIIYILCLDVIHVDAFSSSENPVGGSSDAVDLNLATTIAMLQEVPKVNT